MADWAAKPCRTCGAPIGKHCVEPGSASESYSALRGGKKQTRANLMAAQHDTMRQRPEPHASRVSDPLPDFNAPSPEPKSERGKKAVRK